MVVAEGDGLGELHCGSLRTALGFRERIAHGWNTASSPVIRRLSPDCAAVACEPGCADGRELTEDQHREAAAKLGRVWERIGFEPFQDGVHILDCHLQRPLDLLAERQEEFSALCRAWQAHHRP